MPFAASLTDTLSKLSFSNPESESYPGFVERLSDRAKEGASLDLIKSAMFVDFASGTRAAAGRLATLADVGAYQPRQIYVLPGEATKQLAWASCGHPFPQKTSNPNPVLVNIPQRSWLIYWAPCFDSRALGVFIDKGKGLAWWACACPRDYHLASPSFPETT